MNKPKLTTPEDLKARIPEKVQNRLTQEMETEEKRTDLLNDLLARAESLAFSYLRGAYGVPKLIEQKPAALVDAVTTIAKYRLYQRVGMRAETEFQEQRGSIRWLRDMGKGDGDLIEGDNGKTDGLPLYGKSSRRNALFSRSTMGGNF